MSDYMYNIIPDYDLADKNRIYKDYCRYFLDRTYKMFKYENLPDGIPQRDLELQLQKYGHVAFFHHNGQLLALKGSLCGKPNIYYHPTEVLISNPNFSTSVNLRIDEDCVVMRNDTLYQGLMPVIGKISKQLTENDISLLMADINSRMVTLISATDDNTLDSAKRYLKSVIRGELGVVADDPFFEGLKTSPMAGSSTAIKDLIECHQYLLGQFWSTIGLDSNFNMKREALNSAETSLNQDTLHPLIDDMLANRQEALEKVNNMFGTNITVDFDSVWATNREIEEKQMEQMDEPEQVEEVETNETE